MKASVPKLFGCPGAASFTPGYEALGGASPRGDLQNLQHQRLAPPTSQAHLPPGASRHPESLRHPALGRIGALPGGNVHNLHHRQHRCPHPAPPRGGGGNRPLSPPWATERPAASQSNMPPPQRLHHSASPSELPSHSAAPTITSTPPPTNTTSASTHTDNAPLFRLLESSVPGLAASAQTGRASAQGMKVARVSGRSAASTGKSAAPRSVPAGIASGESPIQ